MLTQLLYMIYPLMSGLCFCSREQGKLLWLWNVLHSYVHTIHCSVSTINCLFISSPPPPPPPPTPHTHTYHTHTHTHSPHTHTHTHTHTCPQPHPHTQFNVFWRGWGFGTRVLCWGETTEQVEGQMDDETSIQEIDTRGESTAYYNIVCIK